MADYGVATRNAFFLLDDDAPKTVKKATKAADPPAAAPKPAAPKKQESRPSSARGGRGGRGRGRGRGDTRKREFDRHESGTGRDRRAKKEGAGKYNWGVEGEEGGEDRPRRPRPDRRPKPDAEKPDAEKVVKEGEKVEGEKVAEGEEDLPTAPKRANKPVVEEEVEEPDNTVSYEDYLKNKETVDEDLNRKVREVEIIDDGATKDFEREEEVNEYLIGTKKGPKKKGIKKKAGKVSLDEFAKPAPAANKRSQQGDRGNYRGKGDSRGRGKGGDSRGRGGKGKGKGGGRGGGGARNVKNFSLSDDAKDFPTLGGK